MQPLELLLFVGIDILAFFVLNYALGYPDRKRQEEIATVNQLWVVVKRLSDEAVLKRTVVENIKEDNVLIWKELRHFEKQHKSFGAEIDDLLAARAITNTEFRRQRTQDIHKYGEDVASLIKAITKQGIRLQNIEESLMHYKAITAIENGTRDRDLGTTMGRLEKLHDQVQQVESYMHDLDDSVDKLIKLAGMRFEAEAEPKKEVQEP